MLHNRTNRRGFLMKSALPLSLMLTQCVKREENVTEPSIQILTQLKDQIFNVNTLLEITWKSSNIDYVTLKLTNSINKEETIIGTDIDAKIGKFVFNMVLQPGEYFLTISNKNGSFKAVSPVFTLIDPEFYVRFKNPVLKSVFKASEELTLEIEAKQVDNYDLLFSNDNGISFTKIKEDQSGNSVVINIPKANHPSCQLRVVSSSNNAIFSDSSKFEVVPFDITTDLPTTLVAGETITLKWDALFDSDFIIQYSTNGGTSYTTISETNKKEFVWTVTQLSSNTGRIRIQDKNDTSIFRVSATVQFRRSDTVNISDLDADGKFKSVSGGSLGSSYIVRRTNGNYVAISITCTHNGCSTNFNGTTFNCPCHDGVFNSEGVPISGPPPSNLPRFNIKPKDSENILVY